MCRNIWLSVLHLDCNERWLLCISTNCFEFTHSYIFSNLQLCGGNCVYTLDTICGIENCDFFSVFMRLAPPPFE